MIPDRKFKMLYAAAYDYLESRGNSGTLLTELTFWLGKLRDVVDWVDLLAGLYDGLGVGPSKEMADGLAFMHN